MKNWMKEYSRSYDDTFLRSLVRHAIEVSRYVATLSTTMFESAHVGGDRILQAAMPL